ncbi:MAG: hypothetical protein Q9225_006404 [Loekoesia sp. 1 TL-2023]
MVRYEIIENLYLRPTAIPCPNELQYLSQCVTKMYSTVLTYLAKAKKFWSENTAKRIAKGLLTNMENEHNMLQLAIKKIDDETYRTISLLQARQRVDESETTKQTLCCLEEEIKTPVVRIAQNIADINDKLDKNERKQLLHWLSTIPCESQHQGAARKIVKGTGRWLLDRPELFEWQNSSSSAIFWLHGIPGAGKSKLTSIIIESLLEQHRTRTAEAPPLAYFYCSRKGADPRSRYLTEILYALLRQLTGRDTHLPLRGSVASEFQRRREQADETGAQILRLSMEEVITHILDITADDPITIVIDALDEVDESERDNLFSSFERLTQESNNVVKIFVSSRNDGDIVDRFEQHTNVGIKKGMNGEDIKKFAEEKVQEAIKTRRLLRGRVSPNLQSDIIETLISRAQGMFRWVELSIETLSNSRRIAVEKDIRSELGKLPTELREQYKVIYEDILESAPSTASIARKTFSWMLAAQRVLTVEEMIAAVALDDDGFFHSDLDAPRLLDICRNLLVETPTGNDSTQRAFQMAHLSVREFMEQLPEYSTENIHTVAVSRLLDNFNERLWLEGNIPNGGDSRQALENYTIYLFEHAEKSLLAKAECDLAYKMISFLFDHHYKPTTMLKEWHSVWTELQERFDLAPDSPDMRLYHKRHFDQREAQGLHLICMYGLLSILNTLGDDERLPWKIYSSEDQPTGLETAAKHRKLAVAKWLLERRIFNPNEAYGHVSALWSAVLQGDEDIVCLLLDHGADPLSSRSEDSEDFDSTPWRVVHESKSLTIFIRMFNETELICQRDPDRISSLAYDWKFEALLGALRMDWEEASQFLIQRGANDKSRISRRRDLFPAIEERQPTTLQVAVRYSGVPIIEALLERSLPCSSSHANSSLVSSKSKDHKAYINYVDHSKRSALHYVMERAYSTPEESESVMKLLLRYGADPTVVSDEGITTLHVAAATGSPDMIRTLIEQGLELEAHTVRGASTLHFAAGGSHRSSQLIRYLIEKGLDPLERDLGGRTPLYSAAASCNIPALLALLQALLGEDHWRLHEDKSAATAQLSFRGTCTSSYLCEQLLGYVNITDYEGKSLLHTVATEDTDKDFEIKETVRLLVDLGANMNLRASGKTPLLSLLSLSDSHYGIREVEAFFTM